MLQSIQNLKRKKLKYSSGVKEMRLKELKVPGTTELHNTVLKTDKKWCHHFLRNLCHSKYDFIVKNSA